MPRRPTRRAPACARAKFKHLAATAAFVLRATAIAGGLAVSQTAWAESDTLGLKLSKALRTRTFMDVGYIAVHTKTRSGDTVDVTGPVIYRSDIEALIADPSLLARVITGTTNPASTATRLVQPSTGIGQLVTTMNNGPDGVSSATTGNPADDLDRIDALGTPAGIRGEARKNTSTVGFGVGHFLGDDHTWAVEGYVLAAPVSTSVVVQGPTIYRNDENDSGLVATPFALNGQTIITTRLLPPLLKFGRYWGDAGARFRPYTGLMGMYAIFYDTKASEALNTYVGGSNPGDTTVSIRNAFGLGPVLGMRVQLSDDWHVAFSVANVKLKTTATLTTRNTLFTKESGAVYGYGYTSLPTAPAPASGGYPLQVSDVISTAETQTFINNRVVQSNGGVVAIVSRAVALMRGQNSLGTYVRQTPTTLDNTLMMFHLGARF
jgi:outer membrane protein